MLLLTKDGGLEEIGLEEQVDLREQGVERFCVFDTDRLFFLVIDDRRFAWASRRIRTSTLRFLAGVGDDYTVWLEQRGSQEDERLDRDGFAELTGTGVEVFFIGKDQTDAGDGLEKLPNANRRYLQDHGYEAAVITYKNQVGVVLQKFDLPRGRFDTDKCDVLVLLPTGYPDLPPGIFFTDPWLKRNDRNQFPRAADQSHEFFGRRWQRWRRHNKQWRPAVNGLRTHICRIRSALESAS